MQFVFFVLAGLLGGVLAGMGMGGGTLTLPILVLVMQVEQLTAQFANLIAFLPSGSASLLVHIKNGLVEKKGVALLLFPSVISCAVSSYFASSVEGDLLKKLFGGFLVLVALASFVSKSFLEDGIGVARRRP